MRAPLADIRQRRMWRFPTLAHSTNRQKHRLSPDVPKKLRQSDDCASFKGCQNIL